MNNEESLIPIEQVIDDMYSDKSGVAGMARDYYKEHYATEEEKKSMEKEERLELFFDCLFIISPIVSLIFIIIVKLLSL